LTKNRVQQMVDRLRELQASSPDIEASAVVSVDGLSIASALPQGVEDDRVSAMSAAMLSLGERIATELGRGSLEQVYIKGLKGYVVLMSIGDEAVLTALAREQAKLGLIFLQFVDPKSLPAALIIKISPGGRCLLNKIPYVI